MFSPAEAPRKMSLQSQLPTSLSEIRLSSFPVLPPPLAASTPKKKFLSRILQKLLRFSASSSFQLRDSKPTTLHRSSRSCIFRSSARVSYRMYSLRTTCSLINQSIFLEFGVLLCNLHCLVIIMGINFKVCLYAFFVN